MNRNILTWTAAALASATLVACSSPTGAESDPAFEATGGTSTAAPVTTESTGDRQPQGIPDATTGGDGSPIQLSPLTSEDVESAKLGGELACSFSADEQTLLLAKGNVASDERAFGVVKVAESVESVSAPGGFDGMLKGATFVGKGKTIRIERTASEPVGGGESPPYPARLTYQRADGASRSFDGLWTCGP